MEEEKRSGKEPEGLWADKHVYIYMYGKAVSYRICNIVRHNLFSN